MASSQLFVLNTKRERKRQESVSMNAPFCKRVIRLQRPAAPPDIYSSPEDAWRYTTPQRAPSKKVHRANSDDGLTQSSVPQSMFSLLAKLS